MSTTFTTVTASAATTEAPAPTLTDVVVSRVWPSVTTVVATFSDVYRDQIGEYSPNVARSEDDKEFPFCALIGAITASEGCTNLSEDKDDDDDDDDKNDEVCKAAFGLLSLCGTIPEDELDEAILSDLKQITDIKNLDTEGDDHEKRSFLNSYSGWCNSFDDSAQAQEQDPYTQNLLAEGAAGFFGVEIESDEQRTAWLKIGQQFHEFYCGEGGARDLWELISTVEPWNDLAAATSVPLTLVWEGGETVTETITSTPTPIAEPTEDPIDAMKKVGLETDERGADGSPEPQERYFDFDKNTWSSSLLTVHETPDAAVQTGYLDERQCENCERGDCPYCGQGTGIDVNKALLGGILAIAGFFAAVGI